MAQKQNTFTGILAALALLPQLVHKQQQTGAPNEQKHASVFGSVLQIAGALAAANNPAYVALINAGITAAVESAKEAGWAQPPAPQPIDPPVVGNLASAGAGVKPGPGMPPEQGTEVKP